MQRMLKSDLNVAKASEDGYLIYYWKMTAVTTKLVTIVNFPMSLIIRIILMTCAGGSDL